MNEIQIQKFLSLKQINGHNVGLERDLDGYVLFCDGCSTFVDDNPAQKQLEKAFDKLSDDIAEKNFWNSERGKAEQQKDLWLRGD